MTARLGEILAAAGNGLHVFPVKPRDKVPLLEGWQAIATTDEQQIREWFERFPGRNVGIACGMVSGVIVVDIDPRHGGDESLAELERINGPLPNTWEVMTGGGGRHLYFRHPGAGRIPNSAGVIGLGIDARGDGGFVVAPPSVHSSGRAYVWSVDHRPDDECLADLPDWIIAKIDRSHVTPAATPEEWRARSSRIVGEGERNAALVQLAGHLLRRRVNPDMVLDLIQAWNLAHCQPPLDDDEVECAVNNIAGRELRRRGGHAA